MPVMNSKRMLTKLSKFLNDSAYIESPMTNRKRINKTEKTIFIVCEALDMIPEQTSKVSILSL